MVLLPSSMTVFPNVIRAGFWTINLHFFFKRSPNLNFLFNYKSSRFDATPFYFQEWQIQRVRIVRRADGYFVQLRFKLDVRDITPSLKPTKKCVGLDMGWKSLYADSNNNVVEPPKYYRQAEKRLNKLNRRKSKKFKKGLKQSNNYVKARKKYAKGHLKVSGQLIKKSLSVRTHVCSCGYVEDRDTMAALNILKKAHRPRWGSLSV